MCAYTWPNNFLYCTGNPNSLSFIVPFWWAFTILTVCVYMTSGGLLDDVRSYPFHWGRPRVQRAWTGMPSSVTRANHHLRKDRERMAGRWVLWSPFYSNVFLRNFVKTFHFLKGRLLHLEMWRRMPFIESFSVLRLLHLYPVSLFHAWKILHPFHVRCFLILYSLKKSLIFHLPGSTVTVMCWPNSASVLFKE